MTAQDHRLLEHFFGAHFHEDWAEEADTFEGVVKIYRGDGPAEAFVCMRDALLSLSAETANDQELEQRLYREFKCYFLPSGAGISARAWIAEVVHLLS